GSYEEATRDPRAAGAIVCTPHDRHLADARLALDAGLHVLVEKPIAPTLEEADHMIAAARSAGRILMVAENFHFMPAFRWVHALVARGGLGRLRELHLVARGFRQPSGWRLEPAAAGGGVLIDGGIHYVHNLRRWGGEVRRAFAARPPQPVRLGVVGCLANSIGARGVARVQWSTVTGSDGTCFVDNRGRWALVRGIAGTRGRLFLRDTRGHERMLSAFVDAMATGAAPDCDGSSG